MRNEPKNFSKKEEEEMKSQISLLLLILVVGGKFGKLVTMVVNERLMKRRIFADLYDFHTFPTTTTTNTEDEQPFRVKMSAFLEKHAHLMHLNSAAMLPAFLDLVVGASSLGDGKLEVVWVMAD